MTGRRCPRCGGLVGADARWCGQCLARLEDDARAPPGPPTAPQPEAPAAPGPERETAGPPDRGRSEEGPAGLRARGEGVVWTCATCGTENPLESGACAACGAPFAGLFREPQPRPTADPRRALTLSLVYPGLGHAAAGRAAEGLARGVVFAYLVVTAVAVLVMRAGLGLGPFAPLLLVSVVAAAVLYALSAADAARAAEGRPPLLTTRMLLYGASFLMLLTIAVLVIAGVRAGGAGPG